LAAVTHLAYRDFERQATGLHQEALKLKLNEIPGEKAELNEIVSWAFKLSKAPEKYKETHPSFHQLLTVALATERFNAICTLAHTVDKQKEIEAVNQSEKPFYYGQSLFPQKVGEWPKTKEEVRAADTIWEALAIYEQVEECSRLSAEMTSKSTRDKSTYAILESLDQAINYLERVPFLDKKAQEKAMEKITKHILDWMNFAKVQMQNQTHSTWRHSEIERNFEEAIKMLRKGDFIGALKYIRNIILEGELGTILGREVDTPLTGLKVPFNSFNEAILPEKPSKVKKEVYTRLGMDPNTEWKGEYLDEAIAKEQVSLVNNVLMLACHQFVAFFIKPENPQQEFSSLVSAMDTLSGDNKSYELNGLEEELKKLVPNGYHLESEEGRQLVSRVRENIKTTKELYSDLKSEAAQKALHESLYFSLLSVVIETHTTPWSLGRLSANGLFVVFYKLVELFVRPFTETLIRSFRENVALQSQGTLNETHLRPVAGLTKAFSTYNQTLLHWKERLDDQEKPNAPSKKKGRYLTGEKGGDVVILLDNKQRYDGMTPSQIGRAAGYHAVTKYLRVANICTRMNGLLQNIQHNVARDEYENFVINQAYKVIKHILSIIPYTLTYSAYFSLKLLEVSFNFLAQQVAMFAIWKWDLINVLIEQSLTSIFESKERAPIFDSLVLDALKDFKRDLDRGVPQQEAKAGGMDETNVKKIGGLLQHLFETIELDKYDSAQQLEDRSRNGLFPDGKK
ncbi:MAG: hypothetical protein KDK60_04295, partial [Chlamydiia bacterium]|nr:hypothetical protein [Chlamydiia bacterium]